MSAQPFMWPFSLFALSHFLVARRGERETRTAQPTVSVVVPARNEAGNIERIFARTPELGARARHLLSRPSEASHDGPPSR